MGYKMQMICENEKCTGCFMCMNICPKNAISTSIDANGKTIPIIDTDRCIHCNLCSKNCPANNDIEANYPLKCYAVQWKSEERINCASGGVATAFYKHSLSNGVHIFGSTFDNNNNLCIRELLSDEDVKKASGSKYVQSNVGFSYRKVKEYLANNEYVLYVGTPCQISGLNRFLGKKYSKLITVDIVCHGTPPIKYYKDYVHELKYDNTTRATFRGKDDYYLCLYDHDRPLYRKWHRRDYYFQAYDEGIINRDNCYNCKYANPQRVSDITVGDFWGLDRSTLNTDMNGKISVVLLNTEHGQEYWNKINDRFIFEERLVDEAVKGNPHLHECTLASDDYRTFVREYKNGGFKKALIKTGIRKRMLRIWLRETKREILKTKLGK